MRILLAALALLVAAAPALAQDDYTVPTRPKAVKLTVKKVGKLRYKVRATVVLYQDQVGSCEAAKATLTAVGLGKVTTTFDAACHADFKVRANRGTRLRARFGGTDTLLPRTSRTVRLRK